MAWPVGTACASKAGPKVHRIAGGLTTMLQASVPPTQAADLPRAIGSVKLSSKVVNGKSVIDGLRTSGASRVAFPRRADAVEAIQINTSGGVTGGDRFTTSARAGTNSQLVLTTQAAERAYASLSDTAKISTHLEGEPGSRLHWLPQELIVFDQVSLDRRLEVNLAEGAEAVIVEPILFGRRAMGETRISGTFQDRITLRRNGTAIYRDRFALVGDISEQLDRPAVGRGMAALASAFYIGPRAEALLPQVRAHLPGAGGASLLDNGILVIRLLEQDGFLLRKTLVPVLEALTDATLPKTWSL